MEQLNVKILDRDYKLACKPEEKATLLAAVAMVDQKMHSVREGSKLSGIDRIAVMTALQIAHELITQLSAPAKNLGLDISECQHKIQHIGNVLDAALTPQENLF
ncbi:cell division protein ZapA [Parvibium lacunae]|uniref:Cell division protein ZapA n=1 Tax=Parvibium lacunae TaxID=1888893 RepID=A0A368L6K7_9BURK|nr:cell division protein ZapA [Parvibium lacunae]RCS59192.1 cell division protein ZapA [Parvibium lacunae]